MKTIEKVRSIRRYDLDWLRIIAVLLLVPFHTALIFNLNPNVIMYIKDSTNSVLLDRMAGWLHQFHMPLLFFISGASTYFALKKRDSWNYIKERFSRLLLPAVFGTVILIPPMTYIGLASRGIQVNFFQHFISFWSINPLDLSGIDGSFTPAHLWFLFFLFIFSILALPAFKFFDSSLGKKALNRLAGLLSFPGMVLLFIIPLYLVANLSLLGDKNPLYYFLIFILGYVLLTDERYQISIDKYGLVFLFIGIVCEMTRQFLFGVLGSDMLFNIIEELNRWTWLLALLAFGHRLIRKSGQLLEYLSSAAFPFYLLHLPLNTLIGYFIIKTSMPMTGKFLVIVVLTTTLTFLAYEFLKSFPLVRFMFGIKLKTITNNLSGEKKKDIKPHSIPIQSSFVESNI